MWNLFGCTWWRECASWQQPFFFIIIDKLIMFYWTKIDAAYLLASIIQSILKINRACIHVPLLQSIESFESPEKWRWTLFCTAPTTNQAIMRESIHVTSLDSFITESKERSVSDKCFQVILLDFVIRSLVWNAPNIIWKGNQDIINTIWMYFISGISILGVCVYVYRWWWALCQVSSQLQTNRIGNSRNEWVVKSISMNDIHF